MRAIVDNVALVWLATSVRARSAWVGSGGAGRAEAASTFGPTGSHPGMMCPLLMPPVLARRPPRLASRPKPHPQDCRPDGGHPVASTIVTRPSQLQSIHDTGAVAAPEHARQER